MNKEIKIYTQPGCQGCIDVVNEMKTSDIKFTKKDVTKEAKKEFDELTTVIGTWFTPTIVVDGRHILVAGRDFEGFEDVIETIHAWSDVGEDLEFIMLERFKTFSSDTTQALQYIIETLTELKERE
jgi:glutaredoxin